MKELIEAIAKALVDNPDQVQVRPVEGEQVTVLELRVHPSNLGKVIGKQGRTARSIRTILNAAGENPRKIFNPVNRELKARPPCPGTLRARGGTVPCLATGRERARLP